MNKRVQILVFALGCLFVPLDISRAAGDTGMDGPDFSLTRITDRVHVVYGPLALPDERNRGFRNNAVIVLTTAGTVIFDPGGSAWAGEQLAAAARTCAPFAPLPTVFNGTSDAAELWIQFQIFMYILRAHCPDGFILCFYAENPLPLTA